MKRSNIIFFAFCLLFIFDFPGTFELEDGNPSPDVKGVWCGKTQSPLFSELESWIFAFSPPSIELKQMEDEAEKMELTFWQLNEEKQWIFQNTLSDSNYPKAFQFVSKEDNFLHLLLCGDLFCNAPEEKVRLSMTRCQGKENKKIVSLLNMEGVSLKFEKRDNSTETTENDPVNVGNQLAFALIFIVLFLPPLVLLVLQTCRVVIFQKRRGSYRSFFRIAIKDRGDRWNIHLIVKLGFLLICVVRIIQAVLFIISTLIQQTDVDLDRAIRFWIDYITFNFLYTAATGIIYYWVELGMAALGQIGKREFFSRSLTVFFVIVNIIFHVATFILLPILARDEGDFSTELFRLLHNCVVAIPMLLIILIIFVIVIRKIGKEVRQSSKKANVRKAYHRLEYFIIAITVACVIRIIFGFILTFKEYDILVEATIIFIVSSIPEIVLAYTLIVFTWIRKSDLRNLAQRKELLEDSDTTIAPEVSKFTIEEETKPNVELQEPKSEQDQ